MMRTALVCGLLPLCSAFVTTTWRDLQLNHAYSFEDYLKEYGKSYEGQELAQRAAIFYTNLKEIREHNSNPSYSWKLGLNEFADWTDAEVDRNRKGYKKGVNKFVGEQEEAVFHDVSIPESVDWRTKRGVVSPVKNQRQCGSCWAFSATEVLESQAAIATGKLNVLSPQEYVSCAPNPEHCGGTGGCQGSTQQLAFNYSSTRGLVSETDYPYRGVTGTCRQDAIRNPVVGHKGYITLPKNNYTSLITAVANVGPIAISVAARWPRYEEGVFDSTTTCGWVEDHAVVLVGYGHDSSSNKDYWIVRNSWGPSWGERGYIRLARFGEGSEPCGMDNRPQDGSACEGDNTPVRLCGMCGILSDSSYPTGAFNY